MTYFKFALQLMNLNKSGPKSDYYVFKENFSRLSAKSINSISENDRDEQSVAGMCHPMCKTCMFFECTCC